MVPSARTVRRSPQRAEVDARLHAVGEEGRARAEEGHAEVGSEAPQHRPVGLVLAAAGVAVEDAAGRAVQQAARPARSTSPSRWSCTSGSARPSCSARSCSLCRCAAPSAPVPTISGAAMAMHDGLGQASGAAGVDDPQRMVERQPQRLESRDCCIVAARDLAMSVQGSAGSAASPAPVAHARPGA